MPLMAGWFAGIYVLFLLSGLPSLMLTLPLIIIGLVKLPVVVGNMVRRLHDTGQSGWWVLLPFVPFGVFALPVILALPGTGGANSYGLQPVAASQERDPAEALWSAFRNSLNFSGRTPRWEFWWVLLYFSLFQICLAVSLFNLNSAITGVFILICGLALLLPLCAVTARRLHDANRSARWLLIYLVIVSEWMGWTIAGAVLYSADFFAGEVPEDAKWASGFFRSFIIWGLIWGLASLAGIATLLILCALPGTRGPNRYGPGPQPAASGAGGQSPTAPRPVPRFCTRCGAGRQPADSSCAACGAAF